ncbi:MAG: helix-turn-helix domain-containing protein [Methanobrevibacter sp.]|nr:helix-turn-helix domain-containing protein [Methanobrevibacter sp.]
MTIRKNYNLEQLDSLKEEILDIINLYENHLYSISRIADEKKISHETVRRVLVDNAVIRRQKNSKLSR